MTRKSNVTAMAVVMQTAPGTFDAPSSTDDVYPCSNLVLNINGVTVTNNEYTGSVNRNSPDVAGKNVSGSFALNLRPPGGTSVPAADEYIPGRFLKSAGFTEIVTSAAIPATAEAVAAGTTTSVTLGSGAAATDDLYKGLAIHLPAISSLTRKQITAIRSYTAAKVATLMETLDSEPSGNYQILPQLTYARTMSDVDPDFNSVSFWLDGKRYDLVDFRPTISYALPVSTRDGATIPTISVNFTATIEAVEDEATPSVPALGKTPLFKDGKMIFAGMAVGGSDLSVDFNMTAASPPNPNYVDGSEGAEITSAQAQASMTRTSYLKAILDTLAMADSQDYYGVLAQYGYTAGSFVQLVIPDLRLNYQSESLSGDFITESGDLFIDAMDRNVTLNFVYGF